MKTISKAVVILVSLLCLSCSSIPTATIDAVCTIGNEICSVESALCGLPLKLSRAKTASDSTAIVAKQDSLKVKLHDLALQLRDATK